MRYLRFFTKPLGILTALTVVAVVIGIVFRFYNLSFPDKQVFDEIYFPVFAKHYLNREIFFDIHPPFGKFIIALGIAIFGDTTLGWRILPCLFGVGTIFLMGYLAWLLFKDKVAAYIVALFVALDGMFIIYSRTGLMDGILFFAIFTCLLCSLKFTGAKSTIVCGIALGLAISIKWPALAILIPMLWYARQEDNIKILLIAAVVYFLIVYAGQVVMKQVHPLLEVLYWHSNVMQYNLGLTQSHPWGSPWWSWPIPTRPVLFLYDTLPNGSVNMETTLGNPFVWLLSTVAVLGSSISVAIGSWKKRAFLVDHPLTPLLVGYFAMWLPWALIHRVVFLYHYMPAYGFSLLMLGYWLGKIWQMRGEIVVLVIVIAALLVGLIYLPFSTGWIPVSQNMLSHLILIKSWLY